MKPIRVLLALLLIPVAAAFAQGAPKVEVYKNANCGCCGARVEHMRESGFQVVSHDVPDVTVERKKLGMPDRLGSCHSARIGGYVIEGHVPAADIRRLLKEKPNAIGLAVPGMVPGSPGMESPKPMPYDTLLVARDGTTSVFARH